MKVFPFVAPMVRVTEHKGGTVLGRVPRTPELGPELWRADFGPQGCSARFRTHPPNHNEGPAVGWTLIVIR